MKHGYDYPELLREDQIARRWRYEMRKLRAAMQNARRTFDQAKGTFSSLARALSLRAGNSSAALRRRKCAGAASSARTI